MHDLYCIALARTYIFIIVMYSSFTFLLTLLLLPPITPPPTTLQSLRPSSQPLSQVAKMLKLGRVQEVVFALGLTSSTDPEMSSHGN